MVSAPWIGDQCSLVEAFRNGERSPVEELEATLRAIEASDLNAFSFIAADEALAAARSVDVYLPFGGVPIGVKELNRVAGWPYTEASVPLRGNRSDVDSTMVARLRGAGGVIMGLTTSSEFGGVNLTRTVLNGATKNPWNTDRTPGGSSGGSAAAVAGGLVTAATAGDGGGSIRIPAGFTGLVGLKCTYGRIPKGPEAEIGNLTAVPGCVSRSVRDTARWFDVAAGFDSRDPFSLPKVGSWELELGHQRDALVGKRAAILMDFGGAYVAPNCAALLVDVAQELLRTLGMQRVDVVVNLPSMGFAWSLTGLLGIKAALGDAWPDCAEELTPEIRFGLQWAEGKFDEQVAMNLESRRVAHNEAMAAMFDDVDFVFTATNPEVAFGSDGPLPSVFGGREVGGWNNGRLTAPSNLYGNPAISIPAGFIDGLPVGLQVIAAHHREQLLLEVALEAERSRPWPLIAPAGR